MTAYNPDGPHSPDLTRQAAGEMAELARYLNYCSMVGSGGLEYPADAYDLLGSLAMLAGRLPQLLGQRRAGLAGLPSRPAVLDDLGYSVAYTNGNAVDHLVSWSPPVALAVADLLDDVAHKYGDLARLPDAGFEHVAEHELTVARAYLGREDA